MNIDDFAPNLSFFFSSGMEPEYNVLIRVARRIWAIAMKHRYGAAGGRRASGSSATYRHRAAASTPRRYSSTTSVPPAGTHGAQRNCNSLHTNSYDEAITTRRRIGTARNGIQLIIGKEYGIFKNQNGLQGSFIIERLTDMVEEAVLEEFDRISRRGGVLGAMESYLPARPDTGGIARLRAQKAFGRVPHCRSKYLSQSRRRLRGVCTARNPPYPASFEEKMSRIDALREFHNRHAAEAQGALIRLKRPPPAAQYLPPSYGDGARGVPRQITQALYESGGIVRAHHGNSPARGRHGKNAFRVAAGGRTEKSC
jgi:methylmalonyl-CoA mutase